MTHTFVSDHYQYCINQKELEDIIREGVVLNHDDLNKQAIEYHTASGYTVVSDDTETTVNAVSRQHHRRYGITPLRVRRTGPR